MFCASLVVMQPKKPFTYSSRCRLITQENEQEKISCVQMEEEKRQD